MTNRLKPSKLGAVKLTPEEQRRAFEETARELECDESEERFIAEAAPLIHPWIPSASAVAHALWARALQRFAF